LGRDLPTLVLKNESIGRLCIGSPASFESAMWTRWYVIKCVNLAVRVRDRGANFGTPVFEDENKLNIVECGKSGCSISPKVNDLTGTSCAERGKCRVVLWRVKKDLTSTFSERRPAIRKCPDRVLVWGFPPSDTEWALVAGEIRSVLACRHDMNWCPKKWIDSALTCHCTSQ
jgi:hypothetical protein